MKKNKNFLKSLVDFVFNAKLELSEVTLEDGSIIEIDDTTMVASKLLPDNTLEVLAEGSYKLMDGTDLVVGADGIVQPNIEETVPNDMISASTESEVSQFASQIEVFSNKNIALEAKNQELVLKLEEQTNKLNELTTELEKIKSTSVEKFMVAEKNSDKPLTRKEVILNNLKNNLNK